MFRKVTLFLLVFSSFLATAAIAAQQTAKSPAPVMPDAERDYIKLRKNGIVNGEILNESFTLLTRFGKIEFPAKAVVSANLLRGKSLRLKLTDGQIYQGTILDKKLQLRLTIDEVIESDFSELESFGYKLSGKISEKVSKNLPLILVGNSLVNFVAGDDFTVKFQSLHGNITLPLESIVSLEKNKDAWKAILTNGTVLLGHPEIKSFKLELKPLSDKSLFLTLDDSIIEGVYGAAEVKKQSGLARITTISGEIIIARPDSTTLEIMRPTGAVKIALADIVSVDFDSLDTTRAELQLWSDRQLDGRILQKSFPVDVQPCGVKIAIRADQMRRIELGGVLDPQRFEYRIRDAVKNLSSPDSVKSSAAANTLRQIGKPAEKLLKKAIIDAGPVLSSRLQEIIDSYK